MATNKKKTPDYKTLYLNELSLLVNDNESPLIFLKKKLLDFKKAPQMREIVACYHLATITLKELLEKKDKEVKKLLYDDSTTRFGKLQEDFQRYKTRMEKRIQELTGGASEQLVLRLLPVLDNLDRALLHHSAASVESVVEGIRLIKRQLDDVLEKEGLTPIPCANTLFDPNLHEASDRLITDDVPEETIVEELRKGYRLKERVIRPALVKVAKAKEAKNKD